MSRSLSFRNPGFANSLVLRIGLLLLAALTAFTIGLYLTIGQPTVQRLAESQMRIAIDQVEARYLRMLHSVEVTTRSSQGWGMDGSLDHAQLLRFNEFFFPVLANHDEINSVIFAHESGREILLLNQGGRWVNRISNPQEWGNQTYWITWNAQREIESVEMRERDYDARKRPWFIGAMALDDERRIFWSEPYIFYTTLEPGITAAMRWQGPDGSKYVIGHDVRLLDLAQHTANFSLGTQGKVAMLLRDGKLMAPPNDPRRRDLAAIKEVLLKTPEQAGIPELAAGFRHWQELRQPSEIQHFTQPDGQWLGLFHTLRVGTQDLVLSAVAPVRDFVPVSAWDILVLVLISLAALALGIAVAIRVARRFGAPLDELAAASDRIGQLQLDQPVVTHAPWREIRRLGDTLEVMRGHLQKARHSLQNINIELEEKVALRTEALHQSQAILQKREAFFRAIFDNAAVGIISLSAERKPMLVNRAFADFTGYPIDLLLTNPDAETIAPHERDRMQKGLLDIANGNRSFLRSEFEFISPQGDSRWGDVQIAAVRNERNEVDSLLLTVLDVTDRREIENELVRQFSFLQALIDTIPNPIFYKGANTCFLGCNQAYEEFFGTRRADFIGKRVLDLEYLPEEARQAYQNEDERVIRECGRIMREIPLQAADGRMADTLYSVTGFHTPDGKPGGLIGVIVDISAQKQAEREAEEARAAAERAAAAKADFLANMSHEIRTPMNAIIGMTHLALQTDLNARQRNYLSKVGNAAQGLLEIINDILDFSKIEAGMMRIEHIPFSLESRLQHLADLCALKTRERGLELLFDVAPDVPDNLIGDPLRLGQILLNLVGNGIKFTEQGEVTVRVRRLGETDSGVELRFEVQDTGIGMNEAQQAELFTAFSQADSSTTRKYGGTGLGLSICRRLVELLGGSIAVSSQPGVGSCFFFQLAFPLASGASSTAQRIGLPAELRTLVVDDSPGAREVFSHMLNAMEIECATADSAEHALQMLETAQQAGRPFKLLITDWKMPGMDGVELLRQLAAPANDSPAIASIVTSAYDREELLAVLGNTPVGAILAKPATVSSLFDAIMTALHRENSPATDVHVVAPGDTLRLAGKRVLLVEDNEVNRELAEEMLGNFGLTVHSAINGEQALSMLQQASYDLVLMDCQMPVMDGYEATRRLRADLGLTSLPVIAMTANAMAGDRELCLTAGMNDHIAKPIDIALLQHTLAHWLLGSERQAPANPPMTNAQESQEFDMAAALSRLSGNQQMLDWLMQRFCESQGDILERLQAARQANDRPGMILLSHTLRGVAGNLGGLRVARLAGDLETLLKQDIPLELPEIDARLAALQPALERLLALAGSVAKPAVHEAAEPLDPAALRTALSQLLQLLDNDDAKAVRIFTELAPSLRTKVDAEPFDELSGQITRYDFEVASLGLKRLIENLAD